MNQSLLRPHAQTEPLDHLMLFGGKSWPVKVASSGKVIVIVEASSIQPRATGRLKADMSMVRAVNAAEITAEPNPANVTRYDELFKHYVPLYESLVPNFAVAARSR